MHIAEGVLSTPILATGAVVAAAGVAVGLKKTGEGDIPKVALLSAAFFIGSLVHVPAGPTSVHLILNGIIGLILGWAAFPSILVALILQAVLFQFGGITTLGVNTVLMAAPAVVCRYIFFPFVKSGSTPAATVGAFLCGATAIFLSGLILASVLVFSGDQFVSTAKAVLAVHLPVMGIEGVVTALCIGFLQKVKPEILGGS